MKTKIKSALIWLICNAAMALCAWHAVKGNIGAGHILGVLIWFFFIVYIMGFLSSVDVLKKAFEKSPPVPLVIMAIYDVLFTIFLLYSGWILIGVLYLITASLQHGLYREHKPTA